MPTNEQRANWGRIVLETFSDVVGGVTDEDTVTDLPADIMHFCHKRKIDFWDFLERAKGHFEYEITHPDE